MRGIGVEMNKVVIREHYEADGKEQRGMKKWRKRNERKQYGGGN